MPTLLLTHGRLHTGDPRYPAATALAIRDDKILAVGADADILALRRPRSEWVHLAGRAVLPGLVDAHVHFRNFALSLERIDLHEVPTLAEALHRVQQRRQARPDETWLQGRGWTQEVWADRRFPTATALDGVAADRPVFLSHKSGHAAWVNSLALQRGGISAETPDPPGGHIQRDAHGQPTGILLEEAMSLVRRHIPPPTPGHIAAAMRRAQTHCWAVGLTGLHDFDGRDSFLALQELRREGELGLRVYKNLPAELVDHVVAAGLQTGFGDDWLRLGGLKIFADGALGPRTALMIEPYEGEPDNRGIAVADKEEMLEIGLKAIPAGLSLTVHAIGDRAVHDILDVYTELRRVEGQTAAPLRHRIEHVQLIHPADQARLAELSVIASMQPVHATSDMEMADRYWGARARHSYAIRTMLNSGATVVFGSDCPIEPIDPRLGFYAAVARRRPDGAPGPQGWYPEQRYSLAEAIHAFTYAAAYTAGQEARQGRLAPGYLADVTIFEQDIFAAPPEAWLHTEVAATVVGGVFKHRRL